MVRPADPLLSVRDLVVRHESSHLHGRGITAVRGVSFDILPGQILALAGESGSGKTSLARAILQLLPIESGQIMFRGRDLSSLGRGPLREVRRSVQAIFQDPLASLSPRRNVLQALLEPLDHFRIGPGAERRQRAIETLEMVGLDAALAHRYPHELSGGQRQRVCLARVLVTEPELIIADEPVSSLDVSVRRRIIDLMRDLRDRLGLSFLFVSHDLTDVRQLADTLAVMYLGRLIESGPAADVLGQPAHPYTRCLLASIPFPDPAHASPAVITGEPPSALTPPPGCVFHKRCPERLERCALDRPPETTVTHRGTEHRVKCHLWSS